jgi:predicted nucleic acid-binding protein
MKRVLLDTNVVLDFLLDRAPFAEAAAEVWEANRQGRIEIYVSAITPVNVFYIARKLKGVAEAQGIVKGILTECEVALIDAGVLHDALALPLKDYEDAVQQASATRGGLDAIVTRNPLDYAKALIPVYSPSEFLSMLSTTDDGNGLN